jgi:hypothetical protein
MVFYSDALAVVASGCLLHHVCTAQMNTTSPDASVPPASCLLPYAHDLLDT